jgi:hypothetical protein
VQVRLAPIPFWEALPSAGHESVAPAATAGGTPSAAFRPSPIKAALEERKEAVTRSWAALLIGHAVVGQKPAVRGPSHDDTGPHDSSGEVIHGELVAGLAIELALAVVGASVNEHSTRIPGCVGHPVGKLTQHIVAGLFGGLRAGKHGVDERLVPGVDEGKQRRVCRVAKSFSDDELTYKFFVAVDAVLYRRVVLWWGREDELRRERLRASWVGAGFGRGSLGRQRR